MDWKWWLINFLHIETLFIIATIIATIYFIWFAKKGYKGFSKHINTFLNVTSASAAGVIVKQPKKEKRVNKHEERCRDIFQNIFKTKFKTIRPDWLKNPVTNQNLELDGFNPAIDTPIGKGLAFEYDGEQHAKYNKHFHKGGPIEFIYQTKKDSWKDLKCKENGIMLIRIPHFVAFHDLERYITQKLHRNGVI
jgi:hypothetical protein